MKKIDKFENISLNKLQDTKKFKVAIFTTKIPIGTTLDNFYSANNDMSLVDAKQLLKKHIAGLVRRNMNFKSDVLDLLKSENIEYMRDYAMSDITFKLLSINDKSWNIVIAIKYDINNATKSKQESIKQQIKNNSKKIEQQILKDVLPKNFKTYKINNENVYVPLLFDKKYKKEVDIEYMLNVMSSPFASITNDNNPEIYDFIVSNKNVMRKLYKKSSSDVKKHKQLLQSLIPNQFGDILDVYKLITNNPEYFTDEIINIFNSYYVSSFNEKFYSKLNYII